MAVASWTNPVDGSVLSSCTFSIIFQTGRQKRDGIAMKLIELLLKLNWNHHEFECGLSHYEIELLLTTLVNWSRHDCKCGWICPLAGQLGTCICMLDACLWQVHVWIRQIRATFNLLSCSVICSCTFNHVEWPWWHHECVALAKWQRGKQQMCNVMQNIN